MAENADVEIACAKETQIQTQMRRLELAEAELAAAFARLRDRLTPIVDTTVPVNDVALTLAEETGGLVPLASDLNKYINGIEQTCRNIISMTKRIEL